MKTIHYHSGNMDEHSRLSCSNPKWVYCPGSVREESKYPDIAGEAAIDGTGSHMLLEMCLTNNQDANYYNGHTIGVNYPDKPNGWIVTLDRIERVQMALNYIVRRKTELSDQYPNHKILVESESKVNPGSLCNRNDWQGTCDICIYVLDHNDFCVFLEIADLKDGQLWVSEKDNTQLMGYLFGKLKNFMLYESFFKSFYSVQVRMTIIQPKSNKPIRYHDSTIEKLHCWYEFLRAAAYATDDPNAPLIPDKKGEKGYCRWCKHKSNCDALKGSELQTLNQGFNMTNSTTGIQDLLELSKDIDTLNSQQLAKLADCKPIIDQIFKQVFEKMEKIFFKGGYVPGYVCKPGKGSWSWVDKEQVEKLLKKFKFKKTEIFPPSLISVSQAKTLAKKKLNDSQLAELNALAEYKGGKFKVVKGKSTDLNQVSIKEMFENIDEVEPVSFMQASESKTDISFL